MSSVAVPQLMTTPAISLRIVARMAEPRLRMERHVAAVIKLDARQRMIVFLLDLYERLRRRDLISRPSFNLPLTQEQLADHFGMTMVPVNRTLRRLREDRLAMGANHVVILTDVDRMRAVAPIALPAAHPPATIAGADEELPAAPAPLVTQRENC